jgi:pimeloyl-ACP methyl ester carboxylesterase
MDRAASFSKVVRRLAGDGLEVVTFDRAGYASRVDEPVPDRRVESDARDLLDRLDGRPTVVAGHSFGGHVALAASLHRPDVVRAVVLYETPLAWAPWWPPDTSGGRAVEVVRAGGTPADAAETFMRSIVGDRVWERLPSATKDARRAEGLALLADMHDIRAAAPYDPASVTTPVVIGRGSESKGQHRLGTDEWRRLLPHAEVVVVAGAGHGAHLSHPDAFADLVRRMLPYAET